MLRQSYCDIIMVALFRNICQSLFFLLVVWAQHDSTDATLYRLVNIPEGKPNQGRVQILLGMLQDDNWADSCYKDWTFDILKMLCEQLGYPGALRFDLIKCNTCDYTRCEGHMYVEAACAAPGYYGCINDFGHDDRILPDHPYDMFGDPKKVDSEMTIRKCINICRSISSDITYAGLQAGIECFCGTKEREQRFRFEKIDDSKCSHPCAGDNLDTCGGDFIISVYDITQGTCSPPSTPLKGSSIGNTFEFGSAVTYTCNSGLFLHGSPSLQCVLGSYPNSTIWNATTPTCEVFDITTEKPEIDKETLLATTAVFIMGEDESYSTGTAAGAGVGAGVAGILFLTAVILALCYIVRKRLINSKPDSTNSNLNSGKRLSQDHAQVDICSESTQGPVIPENTTIDDNTGTVSLHVSTSDADNACDDEARVGQLTLRKGSEHLYAYADINKVNANKTTEVNMDGTARSSTIRKCSDHAYSYADVAKIAPIKSNSSSAEKHDDDRVGWEKNVAYAGSDPKIDNSDNVNGNPYRDAKHKSAVQPYACNDVSNVSERKGYDHVYAYADVKIMQK